ncbi:membrane-spanning 4-domains subfamily A member 15-like [Struthio camelus]|uniref:membrane-spanning 4-domains subfamily A member 15-like n=1 Tax=Struthio camelus TaxID=8801 RepID=UPI00051E1FD7|nr:PREDICTED: membrane-spanning 4-domains subfamily A member 15-like [Struthio camelus australis]
MAATVTDSGSVRIITEVIPATDSPAAQQASSSRPTAPATSSFQVHSFRRAQPKALGAIHIVTGIIHFCCGIILTVVEHEIPSITVASGVLFWLGLLLLVTGSLLVESGKRENILLVKICCIFSAGIILSTLVATIVHAKTITASLPGCEHNWPHQLREERCFNIDRKTLSNGLNLVFVIFCLLEFCTAVAALTFGYGAIKQHNYRRVVL